MKTINGLDLIKLSNSFTKEKSFLDTKENYSTPSSKNLFKDSLAKGKEGIYSSKGLKEKASVSKNSEQEYSTSGIEDQTEHEGDSANMDLLNAIYMLLSFKGEATAKDMITSVESKALEGVSLEALVEYINSSEEVNSLPEVNNFMASLTEAFEGAIPADSLMANLEKLTEAEGQSILKAIGEFLTDHGTILEEGTSVKVLKTALLKNTMENHEESLGLEAKDTLSLLQESKAVKIIPKNEGASENSLKNSPDGSSEMKLLEDIIGTEERDPNEAAFNNVMNRLQLAKTEAPEKGLTEISSKSSASDVIRVIKYMETESLKELTVRVNPKNLGTITIKLIAEGNGLKASLRATNEDTYNLLNNNLNEIRALLSDSNIKVSEVAINIYNEDTTYFAKSFNEGNLNQGSENHQSSGNPQEKMRNTEDTEVNNRESIIEDPSTVNRLV